MGSEQNDSTSFSAPSEPKLCVNGCGFFGTASNMDLCSKCYRDLRITEEQAASAKAAVEKSLNPKPQIKPKIDEMEIESGSTSSSGGSTIGGVGDLTKPLEPPRSTGTTRCLSCNKKVGVTGFKCKCGNTFCGVHRYPESHECEFDFKGVAREAIAKANPVVKADKVKRI